MNLNMHVRDDRQYLLTHVNIYVDGKQTLHAVEADTDRGYARVYMQDAHGKLHLRPAERGSWVPMLMTVRGRVEIRVQIGAPEFVKEVFDRYAAMKYVRQTSRGRRKW